MVTRRRLLTRAVTLALGGSVGAGVATADPSSAETSSPNSPTTVATRGTPAVLGLTGVPDAVAPRVAATTRRYRTLSVSDVEYVSATLRATGNELHTGIATAYGSFDPAAIARELDDKTAFTRVTASESDSPQAQATLTRPTSQSDQPSSETELLVRSHSPAVLFVGDRRIDLTRGLPVEDATDRLVLARRQSVTAVPDEQGAPALAPLLDGDVVAHARLGSRAKQHLRADLPDSATTLDAVVQGTQAAGVGAAVGPDRTTLRYATRLDDGQSQDAAESLVEQFSAESGTELLERYTTRELVVADVSVETPTLWESHERFVDS